ncbi:MAG TPA: dihydroneopterin aldolase [Verrucomicrobiae bacterium]|nr:dihydroneopterin aldolase [Verrucomicrobiae bacterium]
MASINIVDLEVFYCVGVTDEERAQPQRLLLTVNMELDITTAVISDRIEKTINYYAVVQKLLAYGERRSWRLLERLASDIADLILFEFRPDAVNVEVKKFVISQASYVSVSLTKPRLS